MTHGLIKCGLFNDPIVVTMRYRCSCANGEVITISTVINIDQHDKVHAMIMDQMRRDLAREIEQHIKGDK